MTLRHLDGSQSKQGSRIWNEMREESNEEKRGKAWFAWVESIVNESQGVVW